MATFMARNDERMAKIREAGNRRRSEVEKKLNAKKQAARPTPSPAAGRRPSDVAEQPAAAPAPFRARRRVRSQQAQEQEDELLARVLAMSLEDIDQPPRRSSTGVEVVEGLGEMTYENLVQLEDVKIGLPHRLRQCLHLSTVRADDDLDCCAICLNGFETGDLAIPLPCMHVFHNECIQPWLEESKKCPTCKTEIAEEALLQQSPGLRRS
eukprot:TRINITY_DN19452_c0_g1_i1.p1 TRINITY_DN19452_c0_g1~~TRINITY_DN19452_c0_g1_i1.p1  ORF type:complete len:234 (+),score=44.59 TRINITY_DN19452_c0_g1_i1:75-704(+)